MNRTNLLCRACGSSELSVDITRHGIIIDCDNCGQRTPITFTDRAGEHIAINREADTELFYGTYLAQDTVTEYA